MNSRFYRDDSQYIILFTSLIISSIINFSRMNHLKNYFQKCVQQFPKYVILYINFMLCNITQLLNISRRGVLDEYKIHGNGSATGY